MCALKERRRDGQPAAALRPPARLRNPHVPLSCPLPLQNPANADITFSYCLPVLPQGLTQGGVALLANAKANGVRVDVIQVRWKCHSWWRAVWSAQFSRQAVWEAGRQPRQASSQLRGVGGTLQ